MMKLALVFSVSCLLALSEANGGLMPYGGGQYRSRVAGIDDGRIYSRGLYDDDSYDEPEPGYKVARYDDDYPPRRPTAKYAYDGYGDKLGYEDDYGDRKYPRGGYDDDNYDGYIDPYTYRDNGLIIRNGGYGGYVSDKPKYPDIYATKCSYDDCNTYPDHGQYGRSKGYGGKYTGRRGYGQVKGKGKRVYGGYRRPGAY